MTNFAGQWFTTFRTAMKLEQAGSAVHGAPIAARGRFAGSTARVEGNVFRFRYAEAGEQGQGWFELSRYGRFAGRYQADGDTTERDWRGHREFDGIWDSTFGRLRLIQDEDRVFGFYEGVGRSTVEGQIENGQLRFRYQEPTAAGEGRFQLDEGDWPRSPANGASRERRGIGAAVGRPAHLAAVGSNLAARPRGALAAVDRRSGILVRPDGRRSSPRAVRARRGPAPLLRRRGGPRAAWCRELLYFPEPAVVVVASHGTPEGIAVAGHTINSRLVIEYLRHAENLRLLHFSSCLVLKEEQPGDFAKRIEKSAPFPISGYTTSVDWGGSAVLEFTYLDMILGKGLAPADAARQLLQLVQLRRRRPCRPGTPYLPAGFRFFAAPHGSEPIGSGSSDIRFA